MEGRASKSSGSQDAPLALLDRNRPVEPSDVADPSAYSMLWGEFVPSPAGPAPSQGVKRERPESPVLAPSSAAPQRGVAPKQQRAVVATPARAHPPRTGSKEALKSVKKEERMKRDMDAKILTQVETGHKTLMQVDAMLQRFKHPDHVLHVTTLEIQNMLSEVGKGTDNKNAAYLFIDDALGEGRRLFEKLTRAEEALVVSLDFADECEKLRRAEGICARSAEKLITLMDVMSQEHISVCKAPVLQLSFVQTATAVLSMKCYNIFMAIVDSRRLDFELGKACDSYCAFTLSDLPPGEQLECQKKLVCRGALDLLLRRDMLDDITSYIQEWQTQSVAVPSEVQVSSGGLDCAAGNPTLEQAEKALPTTYRAL